MAIREHIRITARGIFGSVSAPVEEWSWSLRAVTPDPATAIGQLGPSSLAAAIGDRIAEFHNDTSIKVHASAHLKTVTLAWIGTDDRVKTDTNGVLQQHIYNVPDSPGGGSTGALHPFQVSLAVSLTTPRAGATGRGRFYLPLPTFTVSSDGTISATDAQGVANSASALLSGINDEFDSPAPGPGVRIAVVSSKGYATIVTGVRVGRILDTQRSRRGDLAEGYQTAPVDDFL